MSRLQTGPVLLFPLFYREHPLAKARQLSKLLLDGLQPLMPLSVSNLRFGVRAGLTPVEVIQLLKVCDLGAQITDFFTKHCQMVHAYRITHPWDSGPNSFGCFEFSGSRRRVPPAD